jgi:hypothetical protein
MSYLQNNIPPTPLISPPLNSKGCNQLTNLLLIDNRVKDYQKFVDSVNSSTFPFVYSISSSKTELLTLLETVFSDVCINRICIIFASNPENVIMFLDNKPLFDENESVPYSENVQFIIDIIKQFEVINIDYLACDTLKYKKYLDYYRLLEHNTDVIVGIIVGVLNDNTGNIKYSDEFALDSACQDIKTIYFTRSVEHYSFLLDNHPNINTSEIIDEENPNVNDILTLDFANPVPYIYNLVIPTWIKQFIMYINHNRIFFMLLLLLDIFIIFLFMH